MLFSHYLSDTEALWDLFPFSPCDTGPDLRRVGGGRSPL